MEDEQAHKDAEIKIEIERNRGKVQGRRDLIGEKNALKKLKEVDQEFISFLNAYTRWIWLLKMFFGFWSV